MKRLSLGLLVALLSCSAAAKNKDVFKMSKSYQALVETIKIHHIENYSDQELNRLAMEGLVEKLEGKSSLIALDETGGIAERYAESFDVEASVSIEQNVLLATLPYFNSELAAQFTELLIANASTLNAVLFDLRGNHSHDIDAVIDILNNFFAYKQLLLSTKTRAGEKDMEVFAEGGFIKTDAKIMMLVDGDTSDVAEVFAATFKDYDKVTVYGQPTKGMANEVSVLPIADDYQVKLTTAFYYRPDGNRITGRGVQPDVLIDSEVLADFDVSILMRPFF